LFRLSRSRHSKSDEAKAKQWSLSIGSILDFRI